MLPDFLIIGAARCGTTYLARNLMTHPDIYIPERKEVHFFDRYYSNGVHYYENIFNNKESKRAKIRGEATPAYLYEAKVPMLIKEHLPNVKLIAIFRNPVERSYSHYWNMVAKDDGFKQASFETKLFEFPRLIDEGIYFERIKSYYELFSKEKILIILFEDLIDHPQNEFKRIYKFLNVDSSFVPPLLKHKINSSGNKIGQSKLLYSGYKIFTKLLKIPSLAFKIEKINSKEHPPMETATREKLQSQFSTPNKRLEKLIEKDLSVWN